MPYTVNGIGTRYYGKRDVGIDSSFITTEWLVLVYIPIIPIGSFRVQITGEPKNFIFSSSTQYLVQRVPFNWIQIRNVYATTIGICAAFCGVLYLIDITAPKDPDAPETVPTQIEPYLDPKVENAN